MKLITHIIEQHRQPGYLHGITQKSSPCVQRRQKIYVLKPFNRGKYLTGRSFSKLRDCVNAMLLTFPVLRPASDLHKERICGAGFTEAVKGVRRFKKTDCDITRFYFHDDLVICLFLQETDQTEKVIMIVQLCGLSGAGKTTLTTAVKERLNEYGVKVEIIDGDEYRRTFCRDLGFSRADRYENIRRLALIASKFSAHGIVGIISAINPYQELRNELKATYPNVQTIYLECPLDVLITRDTKGLYKRALLPAGHPDKLTNLTGVNDPFDVPDNADLLINTSASTLEESVQQLSSFIMKRLPATDRPVTPQPFVPYPEP